MNPPQIPWPRLQIDHPLLLDGMVENLAEAYGRGVLALLGREGEPMAAEPEYRKEYRAMCRPKVSMSSDGVAVIPMQGPMAMNPTLFELIALGVEDTGVLAEIISAAGNDGTVKAVVLDINSPGGFWTGALDLADAVKGAAKNKPVIAHVTGIGASLAYLAASQASAIVASRGSSVGSIGVISRLIDTSARMEKEGVKVHVIRNTGGELKNAGAMFGEAVTAAHIQHAQETVDRMFGAFSGYVTAARPQVGADSMKGQMFIADDARKVGLVDYVGGRDAAMSAARRELNRRGGSAASALG